MSAREMFRCSKNFPHPDGDQAIELLLVQSPYAGPKDPWEVMPRCAGHPAHDDIPMYQTARPGMRCAIIPLAGAR